MNVKTYTDSADMIAAFAQVAKDRHSGMHAAQSTLTFGDYWVTFHDLDNHIVIFGRNWTLEEIALDAGPDYAEASCDEAHKDYVQGLMYGCSHDRLHPQKLGYSHKAHCWPIDQILFEMAERVGWDVTRLDEVGRLLLDHAFQGMRGHLAEQS